MEYGNVEREIQIDASPEVVYEVVSTPGHIADWFDVDPDFEPLPGATGQLVWRNRGDLRAARLTVVRAEPGVLFSFRWLAPPAAPIADDEELTPENSMLVTFAMTANDRGTLLTVTEGAMRELGWEAAVLEEYLADHGDGWSKLLPAIASLATRVAAA